MARSKREAERWGEVAAVGVRVSSARRPRHLTPGEQMNVQMRDRFAGVRTVVDHEAKTRGEIQFLRELGRHVQEMSAHGFVRGGCRRNTRDQLLRDNQQVNRRLRLDVVQRDALVVLVFEFCRDFPVDDFLEKRFAHGRWRENRKGTARLDPSGCCVRKTAVGVFCSLDLSQ